MTITHSKVSTIPDGTDATVVRPSDWNADHVVNILNVDVDPTAAIVESKLALNYPTHAAVTLGTANGLSLLAQALSLRLASSGVTGALSGTDWDTFNAKQSALTFPLASTLGGTGVNNAGKLTLATDASITGGGTIALGGFTLTVPATGTAALLGTANVFTQANTFNGLVYANAANTAKVTLGGVPAQENIYAGMWLAQPSPDTTNFIFLASSTATFLNAQGGGIIYFRSSNVNVAQVHSTGFTILSSTYATLISTGVNGGNWKNSTGDLYIDNAGSGKFIFRTTGNAIKINLLDSGFMGLGNALTPITRLHVQDTTTTTNAIREAQRIETVVSTASTGGAAGFGPGLSLYAETATDGTSQQQAYVKSSWIDATNATRKAKLTLSAYDTAERVGFEVEASGTEAKLGFYGVAPIARAVLATGASHTVDDVITALQNLGFVKQS